MSTMQEARVLMQGNLQRPSPMRLVQGVLSTVAFIAAGFLSAGLAIGSYDGREVGVAIELVLLSIIGSLSLSRVPSAMGGKPAKSANFGTTRLILDTVAASTGLDAAVKMVLSHARSYTKSELAALALLGSKPGTAEFVTLIGSDVRSDVVRLDLHGTAPYHRVLVEGRPVTVNGSGRIPTGDLPQYYPTMRNMVGVPVRIDGQVRGELLVANKPSPLGSEDEACLAILAGFIGPMIGNHQLMRQVRQGYVGAVEALVKAVEANDPYTRGHSERVALYAVAIAREMGFSPEQIEEVRIGAMLHDVGKIGVPYSVLNKPGKLTDEEWEAVKDHPRVAAQILDPFNTSKDVLAMVYHHHERYNGKGYPAGLRGNDIPLAARILRVADQFEAMISNRAHRPALTRSEALQELKSGSGSDFDPDVVAAFLRVLARDWRPTAQERLARANPELAQTENARRQPDRDQSA